MTAGASSTTPAASSAEPARRHARPAPARRPSPRTGLGALGRACPRRAGPDDRARRAAGRRRRRCWAGSATPGCVPPVALLGYVASRPDAGRVLAARRVQPGVAGGPLGRRARRPTGATDRRAGSVGRWRRADDRSAGEARGSTRSPRWPRRRASPTPSGGGRTSSSTAATACRRSPPSARRWPRCGPARARPPYDALREAHMRRRDPRRPGRRRSGRGGRGLRGLARAGARPDAVATAAADAACWPGAARSRCEAALTLGAVERPPAASRATGYGAGVASPGWYRHVFRHPGPDGVTRFFVDAAHALRAPRVGGLARPLIAAARLRRRRGRAARAARGPVWTRCSMPRPPLSGALPGRCRRSSTS